MVPYLVVKAPYGIWLEIQQHSSLPYCLFIPCLLYPAIIQEDYVGDLQRMHIYVRWGVASKLFMRPTLEVVTGCPGSSQWQCCSLAGSTSLLDCGAFRRQAWFSEGHWGQAFPSFCLLSSLFWEAVTEGTPLWTPSCPSYKHGLRSCESGAKTNLPPLSCFCQILWPWPRMHPAGVQKLWQTFNIWLVPGSRKTFLWPPSNSNHPWKEEAA